MKHDPRPKTSHKTCNDPQLQIQCRWTLTLACTNLELGVALEQEHIHNLQLANITVLLEFLPDFGADGGHGHVERVHSLDLGRL